MKHKHTSSNIKEKEFEKSFPKCFSMLNETRTHFFPSNIKEEEKFHVFLKFSMKHKNPYMLSSIKEN